MNSDLRKFVCVGRDGYLREMCSVEHNDSVITNNNNNPLFIGPRGEYFFATEWELFKGQLKVLNWEIEYSFKKEVKLSSLTVNKDKALEMLINSQKVRSAHESQ